jgi:antitoxin CcdA
MKVSDVGRGYQAATLPASRKQRLNVTVDAALLEAAKAQGFNLSALMEDSIAKLLKAERVKAWRENNKEAIAQYNAMIEEEGIWSDGFRQF